jgi:hypothetical protein
MNKISTGEKLYITGFIITSIVVLWLISPAGQLYLPPDNTLLEKTLAFTMPEGFIAKGYRDYKNGRVYNVYSEISSPQVFSLIPVDETQLTVEDIDFSDPLNPLVRSFWYDTGFINGEITGCHKTTLRDHNLTRCMFKAQKTALSEKTAREGEVFIFNKLSKQVFMLAVAPGIAYKPEVTGKLLESILK